ncbi:MULTISPECIES: hydrogenase maturation protease [Aminobacterium]|jgi:hydrogenase maturation protease|uniref:Ni,Fe-hydrogenase maturation factor n=1 Tax=Aminobacterium colombiense (strain DSM 12261 / ALA-1) TaxID=572547 RepID=D5EGI7_AMICL|nr:MULTISPECIES: hydrogenase maturation protease [Aminobacterium]MDD2378535.1 hydrogenase maturation protease [Aminobacterium colombiense]ADE57669.1 Ni,Fe-hydrogenase maturation factor [Aminobacterium colombiense DSM 12261]MDD3767956.1 hydrogenase maturation protease [Aminobacterium colombiense]MDD4265263.1 hydrogenase maturation protease [Aminobacterium colombiense]MDD4585321.1 hydrogenase maturation protease [Aminobacterium colombiense]
MKVFIAGFGNPFREDDSVGLQLAPQIAEWLEEEGFEVNLWIGQQLLPELAYDLEGAEIALFIDADMRELPEGYMLENVLSDAALEGLNIHSMGPAWLLSLMDRLEIPKPEAWLLSISGYSFDFSETLTEQCSLNAHKAEEAFKKWWKQRKGGSSCVK